MENNGNCFGLLRKAPKIKENENVRKLVVNKKPLTAFTL
jgi:hypothetical protein